MIEFLNLYKDGANASIILGNKMKNYDTLVEKLTYI
jgi:hypothetical protein